MREGDWFVDHYVVCRYRTHPDEPAYGPGPEVFTRSAVERLGEAINRRERTGAVVVPEELIGQAIELAGDHLDGLVVHSDCSLSSEEWHWLGGWSIRGAWESHVLLMPRPVLRPEKRIVEGPEQYHSALKNGQAAVWPGCRVGELIEGPSSEKIFGRLDDSDLRGATALTMLSGGGSLDDKIDLHTPAALGLVIDTSPTSLAVLGKKGTLEISARGHERFDSPGHEDAEESASRGPAVNSESYLDANKGAGFQLDLTLIAPADPGVVVPIGAVFQQHAVARVQTLAAASPYTATIGAGSHRTVQLPAWCLNEHFASPVGGQVEPTALVAPYVAGLVDQRTVWRTLDDFLSSP